MLIRCRSRQTQLHTTGLLHASFFNALFEALNLTWPFGDLQCGCEIPSADV